MFEVFKRAAFTKTFNENEGFTILEILIAIAILSFGLLAIATMQIGSIKGNSQAVGITEGITLAQDKAEFLMRQTYANVLDTDNDGSNQDANDDGVDDDGGNFGLDDTVDGGGNTISDASETNGRYTLYWNVAVDEPILNVKTIRIIVRWTDRGLQKSATVDYMKTDII